MTISRKSKFEPVQGLLKEILQKYRILAPTEEKRLFSLWKKLITELLGKEAGEITKPYQYRRHELLVLVPSPMWAQEIQVRQGYLVKELNKGVSKLKVERIRTKIATLSNPD